MFRVIFACALAATTPANAANIEVSVNVSRVLLGDFVTEADWTPEHNGALIEAGQGDAHAIFDFFIEIHDLAGPPHEIGFGNVNFDVVVEGDAQDEFGWNLDTSTIDHDGDPRTPQLPKWPDNGDLFDFDLIDIVVSTAPGSFGPEGVDPRRTLAQNGPEFMGFVVVGIDSDEPGSFGTVEAVVIAFSTYTADLRLVRNDGEMRGDQTTIRVVPEPAALMMLVLAFCALLPLRRR